MNKKGFTLIELLGVILIISLLVIIVLPRITNSVNNFSSKTDKLMLNMIEDAAKLYISDNKNDFIKNSENSYCITIKELMDKEYLNDSVKYQEIDIANTKSLQVTYTNSYNIELVDSESCVDYRNICKPVTEETKTTGTVPEGNLIPGDEYICEVKPGTEYHFFVLSKENNKANLIMNRNICEDGTVATNENTCLVVWYGEGDTNSYGPVTAMNYLHQGTKNWIYIPYIKINYTDEENAGDYGYGTIITRGEITNINKKDLKTITSRYNSLRTRLPKLNEVHGNDKCLTYAENGNKYGSCPIWLVNYLTKSKYVTGESLEYVDRVYGYWTLSSYPDYSNLAWRVHWDGTVDFGGVYDGMGNGLPIVNGVRPVITLPKNYLVN